MEEFIDHVKFHWFGNSYVRMVVALSIMLLTILFKMLFVKVFNRFISKMSGEVHNDPTNYKFLRHAIVALIYIVGFSAAVYSVPSLRTIAGSMLAGAGILAVAIGFASQEAFSNIISGVFIIVFKPFRVNDRVQVKETIAGMVEDITLRHTVIKNFENRRVIIPNSVMGREILVNSDIIEEKICKILELGIGYGANLKRAKELIREEAMKHPSFVDNRTDEQKTNNDPAVTIRVVAWANSSINLKVWIWAKDSPSAFVMGCDLLESIKERFDAEGIEIPFPYQNVVHHNAIPKNAN